jgi:p21-activated kinase 1
MEKAHAYDKHGISIDEDEEDEDDVIDEEDELERISEETQVRLVDGVVVFWDLIHNNLCKQQPKLNDSTTYQQQKYQPKVSQNYPYKPSGTDKYVNDYEEPARSPARDYDIKRKLSSRQPQQQQQQQQQQQHHHHQQQQPLPQKQQHEKLTGSPGTVKQRVKERKHAMKDAEVIAKLRTICTEADPSLIYKDMRKIGQG